MKRYRFPLQPVAVLRAHQERRAQEALAVAVRACEESEKALSAVRERLGEFERAVNAGRRENFSAAAATTSLAAYRRECAAETEAARVLTAARASVEEKRANYVAAHRRVEAVQKLETKARAAHRADTVRDEQADYDDLAGRAHAARTRRETLS